MLDIISFSIINQYLFTTFYLFQYLLDLDNRTTQEGWFEESDGPMWRYYIFNIILLSRQWRETIF
jgi:hypothetical protein